MLWTNNGNFIAPTNLFYCFFKLINCQHSIVGDKFYPILRIFPTIGQSKQNDYCSIHFEHLEFIKCNVDYLDNMKIELRRLEGDLIEFDDEKSVILNIVIKNPI